MDVEALKKGVFTWVTAVVAASQPDKPTAIVWNNPNAPRPPLPYFRLNLIGPTRIGHDEIRDVGLHSGNDFQLTGPRTFNLRVDSYGHDTQQEITDVQTSMSDPNNQATLRSVGLAFSTETGIIDLTELVNSVFERRYQFEVTLLAHEDVTVRPGVIGNTEINSIVTGDNYSETNKLKIP